MPSLTGGNPPPDRETILDLATKAGKDPDQLTLKDFAIYYPYYISGTKDVFKINISYLFKAYYDRREKNEYEQFIVNKRKTEDNHSVSDDEFKKYHGEEPWVLANKMLVEANLPYKFSDPSNTQRDSQFTVKLIHKITNIELDINQLSTGEKILLSLIFALYNSNLDTVKFPKLILLDEPDAFLHPTMIEKFIAVIKKSIVNESKVKVIMTTHSPTTVALSDEESVFVMSKDEPRISKMSKDAALKILTVGVPSLSIHYENRRQVFVESKIDFDFYDMCYKELRTKLVNQVSLNFISSGDVTKAGDSGNCDHVINIVNTLSGYGNNFVFGIIDWDTTNGSKKNKYVQVLGENNRYSLDSYVFDPILVAGILLMEKIISPSDLSLDDSSTYVDFRDLNVTQLQIIIDYVVSKVRLNISPTNSTISQVSYVNGKKLLIPEWYLHYPGHKLEDEVKKAFPQLKKFCSKDPQGLKKEIIKKVIDDVPGFISQDIVDLLYKIQST